MNPLVADLIARVSGRVVEDSFVTQDPERFDGDLSAHRWINARNEQDALRSFLLAGRDGAECALCGGLYPASLLRAAHIKPRSQCTENERRRLGDIAMLACVFGCDSLYELGYLSVNDRGVVECYRGDLGSDVWKRVEALSGGLCTAYTEARAPFFVWHQANVAGSGPVATT
jgi:hypothetical protein